VQNGEARGCNQANDAYDGSAERKLVCAVMPQEELVNEVSQVIHVNKFKKYGEIVN